GALAAICRASSALQHRPHESQRWSGGQLIGGALPDRRAARVWRPDRQLPPDRADAGRYLNLLRRGAGARGAAQYGHGWAPPPAGHHPPVVWRLAWPLGGGYAPDRRDELQSEDRFSGLARKLAPGRALDPYWTEHARI